ncbi:MAG: hypothetical protein U0Y68_25580, partial [Blastocatellia bacterium]
GFNALASTLQSLGFRRDESVRPVTPEMIAGEPEVAAWTRGDTGERLTYTFNPVVSLRVLTCTAELTAELAAHLPRLELADLRSLLSASDPRRVLLGLFAARAVGANELASAIVPLCWHSDPLVCRAAQQALASLPAGREAAARHDALAILQTLCTQAIPVLAALVGPEGRLVIESMRPQADDYPRVFQAEIVADARTAYEALWRTPPEVEQLTAGEVKLRVDAAPAGMLSEPNELSNRFPGGYRALAPYLKPDRIWFVWRYLRLGHTAGMRYDGVVRIDDRWVWFPKPYRVIGEILRGMGQ